MADCRLLTPEPRAYYDHIVVQTNEDNKASDKTETGQIRFEQDLFRGIYKEIPSNEMVEEQEPQTASKTNMASSGKTPSQKMNTEKRKEKFREEKEKEGLNTLEINRLMTT